MLFLYNKCVLMSVYTLGTLIRIVERTKDLDSQGHMPPNPSIPSKG